VQQLQNQHSGGGGGGAGGTVDAIEVRCGLVRRLFGRVATVWSSVVARGVAARGGSG